MKDAHEFQAWGSQQARYDLQTCGGAAMKAFDQTLVVNDCQGLVVMQAKKTRGNENQTWTAYLPQILFTVALVLTGIYQYRRLT